MKKRQQNSLDRNSYVTAALFLVFTVLTVIYFQDDSLSEQAVSNPDPLAGLNMTMKESDALDSSDEQAVLESDDGDIDQTESTVSKETSAIETLRLTLAVAESKKVAELEAVVQSDESEEVAKTEAKAQLDVINTNADHAEALEAVILSKGYEEALVRVNDETVQITIGVAGEVVQPTVEQTNEIYILASTEFTNGQEITVNFEALN